MSSVKMGEAGSSSLSQDLEEDECMDSDYGDEAYDDEDECVSNASSSGLFGMQSPSSNGYTVLDVATSKKLQDASAEYICSVLSCKKSIAKSLLAHFRWDKEALLCVMAEKGPEHLYAVAGVANCNEIKEREVTEDGEVTCGICWSICDMDFCTTMDCDHTFCNDCWYGHLQARIDEGQARQLRCMAYKCGIACDEDKVVVILEKNPELLNIYKREQLLSFIEDNSNARFCPSVPWCGSAIQVEGDPFCEPECSCGTSFCFKCGHSPHSPCTCIMWEKWDEKISGDSETKNWLLANTKTCPKCSKQVEKNGGCNLVMCKCGQAFCWLCGAATGTAHSWTQIDGHSCGRWKEEMDKTIDEAGRSHKRYMHYFERYKLHNDSHKKEKEKRKNLLRLIDRQVKTGVECRDYSWLLMAMEQLGVARGFLAPSYVFAYFFFGDDMCKGDFTKEENLCNQQLFEDQQQMLEAEVERLAGMVQKCDERLRSTEAVASEERVRVINSSVNIQDRIVRFFDLIETDLYGKLLSCSATISTFKPKRNIAG